MKELEKIITKSTVSIESIKKKLNLVSYLRIIFFILTVTEVFRGFSKSIYYDFFFGFIFFVTLIFLVSKSNDLSKKIDFLYNINETCREIKNQGLKNDTRLSYNPNPNHPFSGDLDIFGENSLSARINRCNTSFGIKSLNHKLQNLILTANDINNRQNAIKELSTKIEWCVNFLASTRPINQNSTIKKENNLFLILKQDKLKTPLVKILLIIVPIFNIMICILTLLFNLNPLTLAFPILISGIITKIYSSTIKEIYTSVNIKSNELKKYIPILYTVEQELFVSSELESIQRKLILSGEIKSSELIKNLSELIDLFDNRNILIFGTLINILFLWDLQCAYKVEKKLTKHTPDILKWLEVIGEFESLICFSLFAYQNKDFNYPLCSDESNMINMINFSHPFIPKERRIYNDFFTNNTNIITIITGANMTGKSTFLRSIGINMVLAMNGCPVCAKSLIFHPVSLFTSMRTNDSLVDGSSYFNSEIKRLRLLIEKLENNEPQFILLDEILKGTNSVDKLNGSKMFLEKIIKMKNLTNCVIATHDLELTKIEYKYPANILNYCFELHNNNGVLEPDYKLQKGVTKSMNAIELMRRNKIID